VTELNPQPAGRTDPGPARLTALIAVLMLVAALAVYLRTLSPTVPFWDAGEFIAVSKILGIPHPPGTPFYVLLGRLATLVPIASVAQRVNGLSALVSALAVMLTYLTTLRLIRLAQRRGWGVTVATAEGAAASAPVAGDGGLLRALRADWLAHLGAVVAALMLAWSDNFWENATEAEVYSMMSLAQVLVLWLALRWWEAHEKKPTVGPLLVAVYVMWLSVGLHLGVGMMGLPLMVLLMLVDRRVAVLFAMPVLSVLAVTFGLEKMAGWVLLFSLAVFWIYAFQRKLDWWLALGATAAATWGLRCAFTEVPFSQGPGLLAAAAVLVPVGAMALKRREGRILALALFLMVAGYSTHLYIPIRAAQNPPVNMGSASNWPALKFLLERGQYGHTSMFVRRGTPQTQLDKEFWRYVKRQWQLVPPAVPTHGIPRPEEPRWWAYLLPLALGLAGGIWQARRQRTSFLTLLALVLFATVGMIVFLNFSNNEVRDRDYFFTTFYHVYAMWMGLGLVWLVSWIGASFGGANARVSVTALAAVMLAAQPFVMLHNLWYFHDRSHNYVARDYAYNMLTTLKPNSFVFTNGDNDTYPLWYLQQVEGIRKDVRVVCLALLQTDWYIRQLRDQEPKVPIRLTDDVVDVIGGGEFQDASGRIVLTSDFMVRHILETARAESGWVKQPYFAITAPDHRGYDPMLTLEGLVHRVNPDTARVPIDVAATEHNLYHVFQYRGLFLPDGSWDRSIYKDENATTLTRNYAAAHLELAYWQHDRGELRRAIEELEMVRRMFPDYPNAAIPLGLFHMEAGDTALALSTFRQLIAEDPGNVDAHYYYGASLSLRGQQAAAVAQMEEAVRLDPNYTRAYYGAYNSLMQSGRPDQAVVWLRRLLEVSPNDPQAQRIVQMLDARGGSALPPPQGR
jgi:hypothetical protein